MEIVPFHKNVTLNGNPSPKVIGEFQMTTLTPTAHPHTVPGWPRQDFSKNFIRKLQGGGERQNFEESCEAELGGQCPLQDVYCRK